MKRIILPALLLVLPMFGCREPVKHDGSRVRVAAVQCYSRMGQVEYNRRLLTSLVRQAAKGGAQIVVLPECAVTGYMDPGNDIKWTSSVDPDPTELNVGIVAEIIPGSSTQHFARLSKELGIYLCIALVEKVDSKFYNSQVLFDPNGEIIAHHRKKSSWTPGDGLWMTRGDRPIQAVETPYGKLGLMICHDFHILPKDLKEKDVDIVLYSVGWYGPNTKSWFDVLFPRRTVIPNKFSIVVANWSAEEKNPGWPGHGYSCIINDGGKVLSMAKGTRGSEIVFADLPIKKRKE